MLKLMNFRKAILLIHGFAGGSYDYGDLGNDLQLYRDFDVYTFTLPGHDKVVINNVTKEDWIKAAETQIEKIINNGYKKIYLIGHSMGGIIASHLASKYPEVKKLVLAAPAFKYFTFKDDKLDVIESIKKVPKLFKNYDTETVVSRILKVPVTTIKEFMDLAEAHIDDVKKIDVPTLILHGLEDEIVPTDSVDYVYDNIKSKSVTLIELEGLTHDLFINDKYEDIKKLVTDFLTGYNFSTKEKKKM